MTKTSRFSIYLFFFAFCLFTANSQDLLFCSDTNPDRTAACAYVYDPVCANYPIECFAPPCPQVKDFPNSCLACADTIVESYILGPCPIEDVTSGEPIVGVGETENAENGEGEGEAGEGGVNEEEIIIDDGRVFCDVTAGVLVTCEAEFNPVCGFLNGQAFGTTSANACVACYEDGVDYYFPGNCPEDDILNLL